MRLAVTPLRLFLLAVAGQFSLRDRARAAGHAVWPAGVDLGPRIAFVQLAGASTVAAAMLPAILLAAGGGSINAASNTLAPTIASVAGDRYPRQIGAAIGLLLSIAQLGGMVLPWLTGRATIAYGYRAGLVVPALAAFGVAAGTVLAWQARARRAGATVEVPAR